MPGKEKIRLFLFLFFVCMCFMALAFCAKEPTIIRREWSASAFQRFQQSHSSTPTPHLQFLYVTWVIRERDTVVKSLATREVGNGCEQNKDDFEFGGMAFWDSERAFWLTFVMRRLSSQCGRGWPGVRKEGKRCWLAVWTAFAEEFVGQSIEFLVSFQKYAAETANSYKPVFKVPDICSEQPAWCVMYIS